MKRFVTLVFLLATLLACQPGAATPAEVNLNEAFKLRFGQEVTVRGEDLAVRFDAVLEDSRCPKNVQCVQAGQAVIALAARRPSAGGTPVRLTLGTLPAQNRATYESDAIQLTALDPYPEFAGPYPGAQQPKIDSKDYEATLVVSKP